jgi:tetratricopeptide (TPR) repeat protein
MDMRLRRWRLGAGLLILVCLLTVLVIRVATSGVASVTAGVLEQAVRVAPQSADAHFALGQASCDVNDPPHAINPKHEQAQQQLNRLAAANAAPYMDSAMSHYRSRDFESAIQASEEVIKLQPHNAAAYLLIGGSYLQLDQCDKAITYLKKVFTLTPVQPKTTALAHFQLCTVYLSIGKTDLARQEYEIVKTLNAEMAEELHAALTKNSRDLSTPSSRLDGIWKTDRGEGVEYRLTDPSLKVGVFRLHHSTGGPSSWMQFKIINEEPSGDKLIVREFRGTETTALARQLDPHFKWSPVTFCIPKDGRSMTREYEFLVDSILNVYRYVESSSTAEQQASKASGARPNTSENTAPLVEAVGVSTDNRPYALVNGTLLYEGSVVNGFKIVRIHRDKVEFEKDGQVTAQMLN